MKQSLQLKASQQLTLTPQLQQAIRLLQLSTLDLQQEIDTLLHDNPMLEREEVEPEDTPEREPLPVVSPSPDTPAPDQSELHTEDDNREARDTEMTDFSDWGGGSHSSDDYDPHANVAIEHTLREHLLAQVPEHALAHRDRALVTLLIEALDEDGYLPQSLEDVCADLPAELAIDPEELHVGLTLLQQFDPVGVASRTLAEFLGLQLSAQPQTPVYALTRLLVEQHLPLLAQRDYTRLKRALHCDDEALRAAIQLVGTLNPRPAAGFGRGATQYVAADVVVKKHAGSWGASLNLSVMPKLKVNTLYAGLLQQHREGGSGLTTQLQEAKWLIRNVQQRFETILRVSEAIVARQQAFFEIGELGMRPLVLREIADELGLHESTISRVTTQKYLLCPRGVFELKYFFGGSLETDAGGECSAMAIKARLRQMVAAEDPKKPLSDSALADMLDKEGIQVARRTVAKYREALHIPPVNQRKSI